MIYNIRPLSNYNNLSVTLRGEFLWFFGKSSHFNATSITFRAFLEQFNGVKLLKFWNFTVKSEQEMNLAPAVIAMNLWVTSFSFTFPAWTGGSEPFGPPLDPPLGTGTQYSFQNVPHYFSGARYFFEFYEVLKRYLIQVFLSWSKCWEKLKIHSHQIWTFYVLPFSRYCSSK